MPQANPGKQDASSKSIVLWLGTRLPTWGQYGSNTQRKTAEARCHPMAPVPAVTSACLKSLLTPATASCDRPRGLSPALGGHERAFAKAKPS